MPISTEGSDSFYTIVVVVETYLRVHILSRFGHARTRAQPLAWPVTLSVAGKKD